MTTWTTYLGFDLSSVPSGARVDQATLTVQTRRDGNTVPVTVRTVTQPWSETSTEHPAWASQPATDVTLTPNTDVPIDVTDLVTAWRSTGSSGLVLAPAASAGEGLVEFYAREKPEFASELRIEWSVPADSAQPTVELTSPSGDADWGSVTLSANATDDVGVTRVEFLVGGVVVGSDTTAPYSVSWPSTGSADGLTAVEARAYDAAGNTQSAFGGLDVANTWRSTAKLDVDLSLGRITYETYLRQALQIAMQAPDLLPRYAGDPGDSLSGWLLSAFGDFESLPQPVQDELTSSLDIEVPPPAEVSERSGSFSSTESASMDGVADCSLFNQIWLGRGLDCTATLNGFTFVWSSADLSDLTDSDGDQIPNRVETMGSDLETADQFYASLGYVRDFTPTVVVATGVRPMSLPVPIAQGFKAHIVLDPDRPVRRNDAAHELFHTHQYHYLGGGTELGAPGSKIFWMEATASWAAHQWAVENGFSAGNIDRSHSHAAIGAFLSQPALSIDDVGVPYVGPSREYGGVLVADWLHARFGASSIRQTWEEMDFADDTISAIDDALAGGLTDERLVDMWASFYRLDLLIPGRITSDDIAEWRREFIADQPNAGGGGDQTYAGGLDAAKRRMSAAADRLMVGDINQSEFVIDASGAQAFEVSLEPSDEPAQVIVGWQPRGGVLLPRAKVSTSATLVRDYRNVTEPGQQACPTLISTRPSTVQEIVTIPPARPAGCDILVLLLVSSETAAGTPALEVTIDASHGDEVDRTISNGTVRLGVHAEGHLNVPGYEPSSGGGQTTVGLRYVPQNSDAISPGCLCEGWGVWEKASDTVGWANESLGGTEGLEVLEANWDERQGISRTRAGKLIVTHEFEPSASTPNLYAIRVRVRNEPEAGSGEFGTADVVYRRVMDWDVEPTAFSEFVTIAAPSGSLPGEVITATNDGFAAADPSVGASDLGATGLFEDFGPADTGALFDIRLGAVPFGESRSFLMFYGAAATETEALAAVSSVQADLYSLAQPDVEGGAASGSPNTFIWAYKSLAPIGGGAEAQSTTSQ